MPIRTCARLCVAATALLACTLLAGCGPDAGSPASAPAPRRSAVPSPTSAATSAGSSPSPSEAGPSTEVSAATTAGPLTLRDRLMAAEELPGFNASFRWTEGKTTNREPAEPFGTCQKFAMTSIGAMRVVVRDYRPAGAGGQSTAGELVAQFADPNTAARAFEVLKSWRAQCDEQLSQYDDHHVGALEDVSVDAGVGHWYLLTYGPPQDDPDERWFDAQGMARVGNRIALVALKEVGQDYDYPAGQEPMVAAVRAAASHLTTG